MPIDLSVLDVKHWLYLPEPDVDCAHWMFVDLEVPTTAAADPVTDNNKELILT